jgi:hypothetical protein
MHYQSPSFHPRNPTITAKNRLEEDKNIRAKEYQQKETK